MSLLTAGSTNSCIFNCMMEGRRSSIHLLSFASIFASIFSQFSQNSSSEVVVGDFGEEVTFCLAFGLPI